MFGHFTTLCMKVLKLIRLTDLRRLIALTINLPVTPTRLIHVWLSHRKQLLKYKTTREWSVVVFGMPLGS